MKISTINPSHAPTFIPLTIDTTIDRNSLIDIIRIHSDINGGSFGSEGGIATTIILCISCAIALRLIIYNDPKNKLTSRINGLVKVNNSIYK